VNSGGEGRLDRTGALLGEEALGRLSRAKVLLVGVGGVGGWCAEALARTGIGSITVMDDDTVAPSNLNRQCPALVSTLGHPKAQAMKARLEAISGDIEVVADSRRYRADSDFRELAGFDVVIDAIDSVDCKAALILNAFEAGVPVISSMGAAFRLDPTRVKVTRFDKVEGDGLAKALRMRFRKLDRYPGKFECVWSDEPKVQSAGEGKGSVMQVTATFGMCLAAAAIKAVLNRA
jgi:tRNA A37 threonylcarbamoyladenosine dehydratase